MDLRHVVRLGLTAIRAPPDVGGIRLGERRSLRTAIMKLINQRRDAHRPLPQ